MLTPEEFPYIKSLHVNDCYAYQDFNIELHDYKPFSHLILTGKNGSGKSTILRAINLNVAKLRFAEDDFVALFERTLSTTVDLPTEDRESKMVKLEVVTYRNKFIVPLEYSWRSGDKIIYSYFKAKRVGDVLAVETPSKEEEFIDKFNTADSTEFFVSKFKQYLVNRKVEQAFSQIESDTQQVKNVQAFFDSLTDTLNKIFEGTLKSIEFNRSSYEFYLNLTDDRRLTFNTLSEGFSAFISIFMDLLMRVDLIRKQVGDYSYNPCCIVLIDEPETHLRLQLQEQVLPLLTSLFPNIQFIAATHSPAVIASIKQATIFDLTTKESRTSEETAGRSYSDLMMSHFELNNEYSTIADDIINQVDRVVAEFGHDTARLREELRPIYDANSDYLSPTLKVKFELLMAEQEAKAVAHS